MKRLNVYADDILVGHLSEGDVLNFISKAVHISPTNIFGLLERFGGDTVGAFSLLPAATQRDKASPPIANDIWRTGEQVSIVNGYVFEFFRTVF